MFQIPLNFLHNLLWKSKDSEDDDMERLVNAVRDINNNQERYQ